MKHTDLYNKYREIAAIEREELKKATLAHGGEFCFFDEHGNETEGTTPPIVLAGNSHWGSNVDCVITRVIVVDNYVEIYGYDKESDSEEMLLEDVELGHLGYIIDAIPETDSVKDVTTNSEITKIHIISISREDIENAGYTPNVSDDELEQIATRVSKYLDWQEFQLQLRDNIIEACEYLGISISEE